MAHPCVMRAFLLFLLMVSPSWAADLQRPEGLVQYHSTLPRTFPLIVKTAADRDAYLELWAEGGDHPVLTAYARAGQPFRVLVPPGSYHIRAFSGQDWQGEDKLFGKETTETDLSGALEFSVEGYARKEGWIVDLANPETSRSVAICQSYVLQTRPYAPRPPFAGADATSGGSAGVNHNLNRRNAADDGPWPKLKSYKHICE
ncbi:hypothetical protein [Thioclava kandeliae]|uniref:DUF2846 domain-containing protein n=1 Tax=Thioclava kandeliae TaxID=3070818 RepID=A0ABV1SFB0_9RHOB